MKGRIVFRSTGKLNVRTISLARLGDDVVSGRGDGNELQGLRAEGELRVPGQRSPSSDCRDLLTLKVYSVAGASCPLGSKERSRDPYQR